MKITKMNNISFKRIYYCTDMHVHDKDIDVKTPAKSIDTTKFLKEYQADGDTFVLKQIIPSSADCLLSQDGKPLADEIAGNSKILKTYENTPVCDFLAVCQPKTGNVENIRQLIDENPDKFVGLKFHPNMSELPAESELYDDYLSFAKEKKLPCLFHSDRSFDKVYRGAKGEKYPVYKSLFSRPDQIYSLAKRHPEVPVVMAHCGGPEKEDINACVDIVLESIKKNNAKLYVDISWVGIDDYKNDARHMEKLVEIIKKLKNSSKGDMTERILFGTDIPIARYNGAEGTKIYGDYIKDISKAIKKEFPSEAEELTEKIFYKNAQDLFFDKNWAKETKKALKMSMPKMAFMGACVAAIGFFGYKLLTLNKNQNNAQKNN